MTDMDIVQSGDDDNRYNSNHANTQTQRPGNICNNKCCTVCSSNNFLYSNL